MITCDICGKTVIHDSRSVYDYFTVRRVAKNGEQLVFSFRGEHSFDDVLLEKPSKSKTKNVFHQSVTREVCPRCLREMVLEHYSENSPQS
jgi:hypothetical protein